jgi:hypothetical protein
MNSGDENIVDLDLQAFRYVGDDMTDDELQQFEGRLAEDQAAREAVARAMRIGQAVAFSRHVVSRDLSLPSARKSARRRRKRLAIVASSVAVAFLAGVGISHWFDLSSSHDLPVVSSETVPIPVGDGDVVVTALDGSAGYVLGLWSESASEFEQYAEELADDPLANPNGDSEQHEMTLAAAESFESNDDDEFNLPSWMLAAVSPDEEPDAMQPGSVPEEN